MRILHDPEYVTRVPLTELKDGHAYLIKSRSGIVGVYRHRPGGTRTSPHQFESVRHKHGDVFVKVEYDYTAGAEGFGTVTPIREIGVAPEFSEGEYQDYIDWLEAESAKVRDEFGELCRSVIARRRALIP